MIIRLLREEKDSSGGEMENIGMEQSQWTQNVQMSLNLVYFSNSWAVFIVYLIDCCSRSFSANFGKFNCLYTLNYISMVRQCLFTFLVKKMIDL